MYLLSFPPFELYQRLNLGTNDALTALSDRFMTLLAVGSAASPQMSELHKPQELLSWSLDTFVCLDIPDTTPIFC